MLEMVVGAVNLDILEHAYGVRLQRDVLLSRFTAARIGGKADALLEAMSGKDLVEIIQFCWDNSLPYTLFGGGSNVLVSDAGFRGLVILNRARQVNFLADLQPPQVWAESGANLGVIARIAAQRGLSGLEWAAGIPGTIGGAVVGNAGAHGSEISKNLKLAEILHRFELAKDEKPVRENWAVDRLGYQYRSSILKSNPGKGVVVTATLDLERSLPELVQAKIDEYTAYRRRTQPPGASLGSMFKNPSGDYAGRLIDAAGMKGMRVGDAQISTLHANFFINLGDARAVDVYRLIKLVRQAVADKFGVMLELEIERVGEWEIE
jgi:UDP-N-acetylmuramate dehydrogenase